MQRIRGAGTQKMSPFCHAEEQCGMQSRFTHLLQEARMAGRQVRGNCDIQQGVVVDCTVGCHW